MKWYFLLLYFVTCVSIADVPRNVSVSYPDDGSVVVDYTGLNARTEITDVRVSKCLTQAYSYSPDDEIRTSCPISGTSIAQIDNSSKFVTITEGTGLYLVDFIKICRQCLIDSTIEQTVWRQFVVILDSAETALQESIKIHAPLFSFFTGENYLPIKIDDFVDRPWNDFQYFELKYLQDWFLFDDSDTVHDVMLQNGYANSRITLRNEIATSSDILDNLRGRRGDYPIYWYIEKDPTDSNVAWVTYFALFAFDEKIPKYIVEGVGSSYAEKGSHEIDRESVTIKFVNGGGTVGWNPESVIYAGHLETQPVTFRGCGDPEVCNITGTLNGISWTGGKTEVDWEYASKINNRPIAYVAHGSHALYPGFGFYFVDVPVGLTLTNGTVDLLDGIFDVTEPAGTPRIEDISNPENIELIEMDLSNPNHFALTYSGYLIESPRSWHRIFPFVRYPTKSWAQGSSNAFGDCIKSKAGCQQYIHRDPVSNFIPLLSLSVPTIVRGLCPAGFNISGTACIPCDPSLFTNFSQIDPAEYDLYCG